MTFVIFALGRVFSRRNARHVSLEKGWAVAQAEPCWIIKALPYLLAESNCNLLLREKKTSDMNWSWCACSCVTTTDRQHLAWKCVSRFSKMTHKTQNLGTFICMKPCVAAVANTGEKVVVVLCCCAVLPKVSKGNLVKVACFGASKHLARLFLFNLCLEFSAPLNSKKTFSPSVNWLPYRFYL